MANNKETVKQLCEEFGELCEGVHVNSIGYIEDMTQTEACDFIDRILAAHKRELAEKDEEIAKRDAIIKEFIDKVSRNRYCGEQWDCGGACRGGMYDCVYASFYELIKKAREVVNG